MSGGGAGICSISFNASTLLQNKLCLHLGSLDPQMVSQKLSKHVQWIKFNALFSSERDCYFDL